jgi:hypothetical protein
MLRKLTNILRGQEAVLACKVFPTHAERLAFVYIAETTITKLLGMVHLIQAAFHTPSIDLRSPEINALDVFLVGLVSLSPAFGSPVFVFEQCHDIRMDLR